MFDLHLIGEVRFSNFNKELTRPNTIFINCRYSSNTALAGQKS